MTTILHFLAWTGVVMIVVFAVSLLVLLPVALRNRRHGGIEVDPDTKETGPVIPRTQFKPFVPPPQPHTRWSDVKDRRSPDAAQDPDL